MQQNTQSDAPFFSYVESKNLADPTELRAYSRIVLAKAFAQFAPQSKAPSTWEILQHHVLQERQWALVTLTHSYNHNNMTAVAGIGLQHKDKLRSIGVDCEWDGRQLPNGWERHVLQNQEKDLLEQFTALEIWCAKEAAFKALWPLCQLSVVKELQLFVLPDQSQSAKLAFRGPSAHDTGYISWERVKIDSNENNTELLFTKAWCPFEKLSNQNQK